MKELIDFATDVATTWALENAKTYAHEPKEFAEAVCKIVRTIAPSITEGYGGAQEVVGADPGASAPLHTPDPVRATETSCTAHGMTIRLHHAPLPLGISTQDVAVLLQKFLDDAHKYGPAEGPKFEQPTLTVETCPGERSSITLSGRIYDAEEGGKATPWAMQHFEPLKS